MLRIRPSVAALRPYEPGRPIEEVARELGLDPSDIVKLASNECPLPPFPEVLDAVAAASVELNRYPDDACWSLRGAVARHLGVATDELWFGAGSVEVLKDTALALLEPGRSAVFGWPSFPIYPLTAQLTGAEPIRVPLDGEHRLDLDAMTAAVRDDTAVVWVANPNNPTGTYRAADDIAALVDAVPEDVLVVIDEAYHEYVQAADYASAIPLALERPNVLVTRTFSKVYGLAALRVGYGVAHAETITQLRKPRSPFSVGTLGQVAAEEALRHPDQVAERVRLNAEGLKLFEDELHLRGIAHAESQANFVYMRPTDDERALMDALLRHGVIVRPVADGWIRVTVGTKEENRRFFAALDAVLDGDAGASDRP